MAKSLAIVLMFFYNLDVKYGYEIKDNRSLILLFASYVYN